MVPVVNETSHYRPSISPLVTTKIHIVDNGLVICFAFSWIPIFIIWKLVSDCRRRSRSQEQELEDGNMPFQTNPSKPNRGSWNPPPQSVESTQGPQELPSTAQGRDGLSKEYRGRRRPMPTTPTDPKIRMLPDIDDAAVVVQHNRSDDLQHGSSRPRLFEQPTQPRRATFRQSLPVDHDSDESSGAPGPSFRVPRNYQRSAKGPR